IYEPQELAHSQTLDRLARRVAPPSVRQHVAEQDEQREQRERAWRDEQAARVQADRDKLAAGEPVDCACCGGPIEAVLDAVDAHGSLVHAGECAERWGSAIDEEAA
ncbi:MAG: hypothetical protein ACRDNR_04150, partial [Gaiellaceae bacterium]